MSNSPPLVQRVTGVRAALQYTGIPTSWLSKRPKLPSRNWLIFLTTTTSILSYYIYDRKQCKAIRQEYVDKVKDLASQPLGTLDLPRKVVVYGARYPGDQDHERCIQYFKKYIKPILVAAAIDYELVSGKRHGDITTHVSNAIKKSRRIEAGLEQLPRALMALPHYPSYEIQKQREVQGGVIIIGRATFKEYMAGLKLGWSNGMARVDKEEELAQLLADDGHFDEPEEDIPRMDMDFGDEEPIPTRSVLPSTNLMRFSSSSRPPTSLKLSTDHPPSRVPPLPPILLVPFRNLVGMKYVPLMIWEFFNHRLHVKQGAEAGLLIVQNHTRPFNAPEGSSDNIDDSTMAGGDFDFDKNAEGYYRSNLATTVEDIERDRKKYYNTTLPPKLTTARARARNIHEPTKEESPPTEVELRAERIKKELRWRGDEMGWRIVKPDVGVSWDERFRGVLEVVSESRAEQDGSSINFDSHSVS